MNTPLTIVDITESDIVDILHMSDGSTLKVWNGSPCYSSPDHAINGFIGNQIVGTFINDDGSLTHVFNDVASEEWKRLKGVNKTYDPTAEESRYYDVVAEEFGDEHHYAAAALNNATRTLNP